MDYKKLFEVLTQPDMLGPPNYDEYGVPVEDFNPHWMWNNDDDEFFIVIKNIESPHRMDVAIGINDIFVLGDKRTIKPKTTLNRRYEDVAPVGVLSLAERWKEVGAESILNEAVRFNNQISNFLEVEQKFVWLMYEERQRQLKKWGSYCPYKSNAEWIQILAEESFEVAVALDKDDWEITKEKLAQVAAVCMAWVSSRSLHESMREEETKEVKDAE